MQNLETLPCAIAQCDWARFSINGVIDDVIRPKCQIDVIVYRLDISHRVSVCLDQE